MMRLWWSSRSPYVRIVTLTLHELGIAEMVELCPVSVSQKTPQRNLELAADNPMVSIPTLVFDDGQVLSESVLIGLALDRRYAPGALVPLGVQAMEAVLAHAATARLMIDAMMQLRLYPGFRENDVEARIEGYRWKLERTLDHFEQVSQQSGLENGHTVDLGDLTLAAGLSYLDFRLSERAWRDRRPGLAGWYDHFAQRLSFTVTEYVDG
jgi:glutathione S-transferase